MTKKILSTIVSIALLTGACAMSVAAFSETDNEIARIMNQYSYYSEDSPRMTAVRPVGNDIVSRYF